MAEYPEYNHNKQGSIYPLKNPIAQGYAVREPDTNPAEKEANGRFVNQNNEKIDFWIENFEASFGLTGSTAQSRTVRQFMPHNVVQPTVTVTGKAPNQFQLNRLASFIRSSQWNAFNPGSEIRHEITPSGQSQPVQTIRLVVRNGKNSTFPYNGSNVKGIHKPWVMEGYVKSMKAGGKRENPAPEFSFEFFIVKSEGIDNDTRVYGAELKPWLSWIKKDGGFVTVTEKNSRSNANEERNKQANENSGHNVEKTIDEVIPLAEGFEGKPGAPGSPIYGPPVPEK